MKKVIAVVLLSVVALQANAKVYKTETQTMSYGSCISKVKSMMSIVPAKVIASTSIVSTVRFKTAEGSMLVTCSDPDNQITLMYTTNSF